MLHNVTVYVTQTIYYLSWLVLVKYFSFRGILTDLTDVFVCLRGGYYRNATIEQAAVPLCDVTVADAKQTATGQETAVPA